MRLGKLYGYWPFKSPAIFPSIHKVTISWCYLILWIFFNISYKFHVSHSMHPSIYTYLFIFYLEYHYMHLFQCISFYASLLCRLLTDRRKDIQTDRQIHQPADRPTNWLTDRQTNGQTDRNDQWILSLIRLNWKR